MPPKWRNRRVITTSAVSILIHERGCMKYKLATFIVFLTLAVGYCAPKDQCVGIKQNPALCRGTFPPKPAITIRR